MDLFAERGFAEVSLDDVAAAAGVTRGAVYHHYRSKSGLFGAVAAQLQAGVAEAVVAAAEEAGDLPGEQLRAGCHAFLDAITAGPAARILLIDAPAAASAGRGPAHSPPQSGPAAVRRHRIPGSSVMDTMGRR